VTADAAEQAARRLLAAGRHADARAGLLDARARFADHPGLAFALADCLHAGNELSVAIDAYRQAVRLDGSHADGWFGLGCALLGEKRFGEAAAALREAARLAPRSGRAAYNLGKALFELGHVGDAVEAFRTAARLDMAIAPMAEAGIACILPGDPAASTASIRAAREHWSRTVAPGQAAPPAVARGRGGKLRIGYMSAFFGAANWMKPVFGVINRHDRSRFEIHMIADGAPPGADSGYSDYDTDYVHDITGVPNARAAAIIASLGLHILVDLNGYSAQERLPLLMRKPAPVLVGWFNHFAPTGIAAYDWLVGDDTVIPRDEEPFYAERIFRVRGSYLAFDVRYPVPDISPPPCRENGAITFGCFGSQYKFTGDVLDAWAAILRGAPDARLLLKNSALEDGSVRDDMVARFAARGIAAGRVHFAGRSPHWDFLDAYRRIDIALDTFPYNGGTTTTEALWQGVPVIAFSGDRWAARTSATLLRAAGLQDWLAGDVSGYVRAATAIANTGAAWGGAARYREKARRHLAASAACDTQTLCMALETFYTTLR
jgi:protein O-GlcNAc transferase